MYKLRMMNDGRISFEENNGYSLRKNSKQITFSKCYNVPVSDITFNHKDNQVRTVTKDLNHLEDLKASILSKGLETPIVLSIDKNGVISVESGHHRFTAFDELEINLIPAYFVTYNASTKEEESSIRTDFLQKENNHNPVKQMTMKDAEKYLFVKKEYGVFIGLKDSEIRRKASIILKDHYTHFTESKIKHVITSFMKGIAPPSFRAYSIKDRREIAKKFSYTVKPSQYDYNHGCFYVNANTSNCLKQVATIDKYADIPSGVDNGGISIHVFCNTGSKDSASSKSNRTEFLAQMMIANTNYSRFQVEKIYFLPDLVAEIECEIHDWTVNDEGVGSFVKQEKNT